MSDNDDKQFEHSRMYKYGWWLIGIGTVFFALFIVDYNHKLIFDYKGVDNLAGIISATTGICFSLAGLIFVLDNLTLQRETLLLQKQELKNQIEEMKVSNQHFNSQNQALINQQYQTTFFNILGSHSERVSILKFGAAYGYESLVDYYKNMSYNLNVYLQSVLAKDFKNYQETHRCPPYRFMNDKASWDAYFENLMTLLRFLDSKLNDELYYELFYNNFSTEEKYFIGLYCDCFDNEYTKYLRSCKYNFKKYYDGQDMKYELSEKNYFPQVAILQLGHGIGISEANLLARQDTFPLLLKCEIDLLDNQLEVVSVDVNVFDIVNNAQKYYLNKNFSKTEMDIKNEHNGYLINFSAAVNTAIQQCQAGSNNVYFIFHLNYNGQLFKIQHYVRFSIETARRVSGVERTYQIYTP